ncbi:MAG: AAA family ATPase [Planctomycetales bacterium]|nr:AAA family ATPase [Planctomycetales bacterium]
MKASEYPVTNIPGSLKERDQWVAWKEIVREGRPTKIPIDVRSGQFASVSDSNSWASFDEAMDYFDQDPDLSGLGFVFTAGDPFAGVDLDDCLDKGGQFIWGQDIVKGLNTYTEVSPSGRGVKLFLRGAKPASAGSRRDGFGPLGIGKVEVYDQGRFFAVTGRPTHGFPNTVENRHADFEAMCDWLWPAATATGDRGEIPKTEANDHRISCLDALLAMNVADHNDGSHRLFAACCRCVEHDLNDQEALETIRAYEESVPFPIHWSDTKILKRIRDAENRCTRGAAIDSSLGNLGALPTPLPVAELVDRHPKLRTPIIDGLLREGETMNVIAPPKAGKSWLVTDLALSIATGQPWLGAFPTRQGNVLLLDNELHAETSADRIPRVADARDVRISDTRDSLFIDNLRGRLLDFERLRSYFDQLAVGFFKVVVMDAFYRFLPKDTDENSNGNLTDIYNLIDQYANQLGCSFVLVHHASKGNQSGKSVTDVGAGAGSQSRATDTHLVLRQHQEPGCVVVDAAVRSWPPLEPRCLRWEFPVWRPDDYLDPADLKFERPNGRSRSQLNSKSETAEWTAESFAKKFVSENPEKMTLVRSEASKAGISQRLIKELQEEAEQQGLIFRWKSGANKPVSLASVPQPEEVMA